MLLKAGTYRFNDVISFDTTETLIVTLPLTITINGSTEELTGMGVNYGEVDNIVLFPNAVQLYTQGTWFSVDDVAVQEHTITKDTEVDDTFGTWYIANTNYNEVNPTEDKEYIEKSSWYKSVADAIRNKKGTTDPILRDDFASEISSITGGEETPYYDGTVIIEKAESVLGLRRFKETITPIEETYTTWEDLWNNYGFDIEPISLNLGAVFEVQGLGCYIKTNSGEGVVCKNYNADYGYDYIISTLEELTQLGITQFNILSTVNSTVDEWLLANTEGVSL